MPVIRLDLTGNGLTNLRVEETSGFAVMTVSHKRAPEEAMMAILDRSQQHLLYLWLKERLDK